VILLNSTLTFRRCAGGYYHLFVIFAVLDVSLAVNSCLNRSFFTFITNNNNNKEEKEEEEEEEEETAPRECQAPPRLTAHVDVISYPIGLVGFPTVVLPTAIRAL